MNNVKNDFLVVCILFFVFLEVRMMARYLRLVMNKPIIKKVERTGYQTTHGEAVFYVKPIDDSLVYSIKVKTTILTQFAPFFFGSAFYVIMDDEECMLLIPVSLVIIALLIFVLVQFVIS